MKTFGKFKVDTFTKADNGFSFRRIVAKNGVHKLPYKCTVYSDGCGSMVHVEIAAVLTGIDHVYIPPREQKDVITDRFDCKEIEWVPTDGTPVDYLGMRRLMLPHQVLKQKSMPWVTQPRTSCI